jgi:hypothetical protein
VRKMDNEIFPGYTLLLHFNIIVLYGRFTLSILGLRTSNTEYQKSREAVMSAIIFSVSKIRNSQSCT